MVAYRFALALALVLAAAGGSPAMAASPAGADRTLASGDGRAQALDPPVRRARPRVEIQPELRLRRDCVTTTREFWRPYWGWVVMPDMRCRWVRQ
jgi:hypothetical protein